MGSRARVGSGMQVDPRFAVDAGQLDAEGWDGVFGRSAPLVVEVGFGNGISLVAMAKRQPEHNFVGVELYGPGIEKLGKRLAREGLGNVRIIKGEGMQVLAEFFGTGRIDAFHCNFPDPWPKVRHHKRRFVGPALAVRLFDRVRSGGDVFLATDYDCYAMQMRDTFEAHPGFVNMAGNGAFLYEMPDRIVTKYERKFAARGATIRYLWYRRAEGGGFPA